MRKVVLGKTGVEVSAVSLGTWSFGSGNVTGGQSVGWYGQEDQDSREVLIRAWESGINHWDTADVYGNGHSEEVIGSMWSEIPREEIFLATKVGWDRGPYDHWYHPQHMREQMERSLRNLHTDCLDLIYLHHCNFGGNEEYFDDALAEILKFRQEGKVRFIGLSDWDLAKIMKFVDRVGPDVIQPYRNVMDDTYVSSGLQAWIDKHHAGVCFFSPLKHGLLTGKYTEPATFPRGDFRRNVKDFSNPEVIIRMQENRQKLEEKFRGHPQPVLRGLIDALLMDAPTGCVLLGQRNIHQVDAAATLGDTMDKATAEWVKALYD
ncbi:MAG: aldo/keto reductase [Fidelibacterota bacterium]